MSEMRIFCRERRTFVKVRLALQTKTVGSFNAKNSRQSGFCNKNVRLFALFVLIFAPKNYCWASMPNLQATALNSTTFSYRLNKVKILFFHHFYFIAPFKSVSIFYCSFLKESINSAIL